MKDTNQVETIYRAKKKYLGKEYIKGHLVKDSLFDRYYIINWFRVENDKEQDNGYVEIDQSTLSIHFINSGMNDSEGTPIFASLSENGNGGDEIKDEVVLFSSLTNSVVMVEKLYIGQYDMYQGVYKPYFNSFKVTGIHTVKE